MIYLNSPSTRITLDDRDRVSIALEPATILRQRYRDGAGSFTEVEFASSADEFAIFPLKRFQYLPGKASACQNERYDVRTKVFNSQTDLCASEETLPPNTCPAEYCIASELARGDLAQYFGRRPEFSSMSNMPFNQAAMYTTWTVNSQNILAASTRGYITSRCLACIGQHIQQLDRLRQRTRPLRCRVCPPAALLHRQRLWRSRLDAHVLLPDAWLVLVHRLRDTPTSSSTTIFGNQFPAARSSTTNFEPF